MSIQTNKLPDNPNIEVIKAKETGLFTNYIFKAIPLAFDESMSYYETLCGLLSYLKDTVIPTVNNNADAVAELQTLYEELRTYVDDYFKNLDVQEEINNKLDAMVTDGTFEKILNNYTKIQKIYNTHTDLLNDNNLVSGMKAQTLGYYEINDGGGTNYLITDIQPINQYYETKNNLYILPIFNDNIINPKQFGAYCDGIHDDSDALENCLNYTNTLSSSNGTWKRTILIPAIIRVTRKINCKTDQFKIYGTSLNNSRIIFDNEISYLNFEKDNNEISYEIEIENVKLYGNYLNTNSILKMTNCANCYLTRVETANGGLNQYNISFIHCSLIFMNKCTIVGSNNVKNYPGNRNGIYIERMGSIFNFTNANCWNLNNLFKFKGLVQNINIENNWIECIKSLIDIDCDTDMRYMNYKIINNTINTHKEQNNFIPSTFNFIKLNMLDNTNFYSSSFTINNNTIYLWDVNNINGNSLIFIDKIGASENSTLDINFNSNIFSGKNLNDLKAYVFYNNDQKFYSGFNIKFKSIIGVTSNDTSRITDNKKIIKCGYNEKASAVTTFPNGIYLSKDGQNNTGNIYYDNGGFYGGYNGNIKQIPERVGTPIPYATQETMLAVINKIVDVLANSHISNRQV